MAYASESPRSTVVGIVGARGYVGAELIRLIDSHPRLQLGFVVSRALAGQAVVEHVEGSRSRLRFEDLSAEEVARRGAEVLILAMPNGAAGEFVAAVDRVDAAGRTVIVDVSADHRLNDAWVYGLPERFRDRIRGVRRIANPGCYATAMQLAIAPMLDDLAEGPVHVFGVSGYSGAGTTPSPKNDPEVLCDNLMPYQLTGHFHAKEVARHLGHPVRLLPHVAPFFRGMSLTIAMLLREPVNGGAPALLSRYRSAYLAEPLVAVREEAPMVRDIAGRHGVAIGGFAVDEEATGREVVVVATIDNLLKGAATQVVQNVNLACRFNDELEGIRPWLNG